MAFKLLSYLLDVQTCFVNFEEIVKTFLLLGAEGPRKKQVTAEVIDKEYCQVKTKDVRNFISHKEHQFQAIVQYQINSIIFQAKKAENRFRVRQGTKFYRVKCKNYDRQNFLNDSFLTCDWSVLINQSLTR